MGIHPKSIKIPPKCQNNHKDGSTPRSLPLRLRWVLNSAGFCVHLVMTLGSPESLDQPHFVLLNVMYAWKCTPVSINCKNCPRNCIQYPSRTPNCGDDNHQCRGTKTFCDPQQRLVVSCSKNTTGKRAKGYQNTKQMQQDAARRPSISAKLRF